MVAYSFKRRFVDPIRVGLGIECDVRPMTGPPEPKTHTIRADRKRHARVGELIQLYCGMRTRECFLIGVAGCIVVWPIRLSLGRRAGVFLPDGERRGAKMLDVFARGDGFKDWADMREFWRVEHPGVDEFNGAFIKWARL